MRLMGWSAMRDRTSRKYALMALCELTGKGHSQATGSTGHESECVLFHVSCCSGNGAPIPGIGYQTRGPKTAW